MLLDKWCPAKSRKTEQYQQANKGYPMVKQAVGRPLLIIRFTRFRSNIRPATQTKIHHTDAVWSLRERRLPLQNTENKERWQLLSSALPTSRVSTDTTPAWSTTPPIESVSRSTVLPTDRLLKRPNRLKSHYLSLQKGLGWMQRLGGKRSAAVGWTGANGKSRGTAVPTVHGLPCTSVSDLYHYFK